MPSWRLNPDGTATDKNTGITYNRDGSVVKKEEESEMEGRRDYGYDSFGNSLRPGDDEGSTEPPNNFAIYINGKKWKVFQGKGQYADDAREKKQHYDLKAWAHKKSQETGKKWEVYITGEKATEGMEEGWKSKVAGAALAGAAALGGGAAQASEPLAVMATIKMELPDGSVKTFKKDLGHSYDFRIDDAKKDLENLLDRKGIKKYTIHLDRYNSGKSSEKKTDYMNKTPSVDKGNGSKDYMDKGPYTPKSTKATYLDKSSGKEFRDIDNY
jgi:L-rhamnose mutarotase